MSLYREQIVSLWQVANVSLSLRTKLWPTISTGQGFSRLRLAEEELGRLWEALGMGFDVKAKFFNDETTRLGDFMGIDNRTYCMCSVSADLFKGNKLPEASQSLGALDPVEAERLQIYERLDSSKAITDIGRVYNAFNIPAKEKMKKVIVAKLICE
jgi:hypothetical protein